MHSRGNRLVLCRVVDQTIQDAVFIMQFPKLLLLCKLLLVKLLLLLLLTKLLLLLLSKLLLTRLKITNMKCSAKKEVFNIWKKNWTNNDNFHISYRKNNSLCIWIWRNRVFVTNSDFLIPISMQPNVVDLKYFKLWILLDTMV